MMGQGPHLSLPNTEYLAQLKRNLVFYHWPGIYSIYSLFLSPRFPSNNFLIFLSLSICYKFISKWLWVKGTSSRLHVWGTVLLPQDGCSHQSVTAVLEPPTSAGSCVGHVFLSLLSISYVYTHSKAGLSDNLLKTIRAITINRNMQGIQSLKLEFIHSQIPKLS